MALTGLTGIYGGQQADGSTGAGALASRRGLPGYGPSDNPYGQAPRDQWGDAVSPAYAAPGWNGTLRREANEDVYAADFVLTDDCDYTGLGEGSTDEQTDQTPYPVTVATGYSGRGRHRGYEEMGTAPGGPPANHAAPYPRTWTSAGRLRPEPGTGLDDQWTEQEARRVVHEQDHGAGRTGWTAPDEPEFHRRDTYYTSQGETLLEAPGSDQLRYAPQGGPAMGRGAHQVGQGDDVAQGGGSANGYGYGTAHVQNYRQQTDGVPFNFNWLDASERPFIPKGQATNAAMFQTYDGPDSPYGAAGDQTDYHDATTGPAMVSGPASPYNAPPDPSMGQGYGDDGDDEFAW